MSPRLGHNTKPKAMLLAKTKEIYKGPQFKTQRLCSWSPHLDRASLQLMRQVLCKFKSEPNCRVSWPLNFVGPVFVGPRTEDFMLSVVANVLLVTPNGLGWLTCADAEEDLAKALRRSGPVRWPYGRSVSQAVRPPKWQRVSSKIQALADEMFGQPVI